MREADPAAYIQTVARLIPREVGLNDNDRPLAELSAGQLMPEIAQIIAALANSDVLADHERARLLGALDGKQPDFAQPTPEEWERKHAKGELPGTSFRNAPPMRAELCSPASEEGS